MSAGPEMLVVGHVMYFVSLFQARHLVSGWDGGAYVSGYLAFEREG
jgi:hypothetical protein